MEEMMVGLIGHCKKGADGVIAFIDGLPLVGPFMKYGAYGFAAYYLVGNHFFGVW